MRARSTPISRAEALRIAQGLPTPDLAPFSVTSQEIMTAVMADADGSTARLRAILKPYVDGMVDGMVDSMAGGQ